jgi:hypothetical protein
MGDERDETAGDLRAHGETMVRLGEAVPGSGPAGVADALKASGPWPEDLRASPLTRAGGRRTAVAGA